VLKNTKDMFDKLFNRDKQSDKPSAEESLPPDPGKLAFEMLILTYLEKYGIDGDGNKSLADKELNEEDVKWIKQTLEVAGFVDNIEEVIIAEWEEKKKLNNSIKPKVFSKVFLTEFHNLKIESVAPEFVRERNKKFIEAYDYVINTIERIQGWLEDEGLRTRVESDFRRKPDIQSTMYQCTTPFCIISLGCDQMGRYNLVYSVDHRLQEMISENMASTLIRRIYQFTPGEMEPFVKIGSLYDDCIGVFNQIIEEAKVEPYHKIIIKEKHEDD
tara:strand:+ start:703 stop:1518 length:816 start_codon:yes stop_codon:yes gene_type:complete